MLVMPVVADEVDDLISDLEHGTSDYRLNAAKSLGEIGDPRAIRPLIAAIEDEGWNESVRMEAAMALSKMGALDDLISDLKYGRADIRRATAEALGEIGDTKAIDPLIEALSDEDDLVRIDAAIALSKMNNSDAIDTLRKALNEEGYNRIKAAKALGDIDDPKAAEALISGFGYERTGYGESYLDVRREAILSIVKIGEPAVVPLIKALENEDPLVREGAVIALSRISPKANITDQFTKALDDEESRVRLSAAIALGNV
jgi:HEAT repeat protein